MNQCWLSHLPAKLEIIVVTASAAVVVFPCRKWGNQKKDTKAPMMKTGLKTCFWKVNSARPM